MTFTYDDDPRMEKEYEASQKEYAAAKEVQEHLEKALQGMEPKKEGDLQEQFEQKQMQRNQCREELEAIRLLESQIHHSLTGIQKNGMI